jgi:elongator complex protein 3
VCSSDLKKKFEYMEDVQKENETASVRCVGLTFEPRPDWCRKEQIDFMLGFGVTRVEIGVQNPDDRIYKMVDRGHTVKDVVESTQELKDSGLKVGYHMMPGIMGYKPRLDFDAFKKIFTKQEFKPDMVKIYPCIILKDTEYYENWVKGLQWDWMISRQRFFGVPFPVWYCRKCGHLHYGSKALNKCPVCDHPMAYFEIKAENF